LHKLISMLVFGGLHTFNYKRKFNIYFKDSNPKMGFISDFIFFKLNFKLLI